MRYIYLRAVNNIWNCLRYEYNNDNTNNTDLIKEETAFDKTTSTYHVFLNIDTRTTNKINFTLKYTL